MRKPADQDPELYAMALEAVRRYRAHLKSDDSIARFAVWFVSKQMVWRDIKKDPPQRDLPILLYDPTHRIVHLGYISVNGPNIIGKDARETFTPQLWHAIPYR